MSHAGTPKRCEARLACGNNVERTPAKPSGRENGVRSLEFYPELKNVRIKL